ncbi:MAG: hypothetical protein KBS83_09005 [Lachnospiraceae bacterium]|nr:hypothetical protein [Candidatus Equihabitans merdae]
MAGIEKITDEILQEAKVKAEEILSAAREAASEIEAAAKAEGEAECETIVNSAKKKAEEVKARAVSQSSLEKRQAVLLAKQEIIENVIGKAYADLENQGDEAYFAMIRKLLIKSVRPQEGEISFSAKDMARLPEGFAQAVAHIAEAYGGKLSISKEAAPIDSGFVLKYGGIEENCSLKALFDSMKDRMQDAVNAVLW